MNIAELFIKRPVMTTLVMLSILLFGIVAYTKLPVSDLPNVDFPTILVTAVFPGASPETMAADVATVLEKQFATISGIDQMSSVSGQGYTNIVIQFNLSRKVEEAAVDVQVAISACSGLLPQQMPTPPTFQKVNPADQPILYLSLTSPTLPLHKIDEYAETMVGQRLNMVKDVSQVLVFGAQKYAVRIQVDPKRLANMGLGIDEVKNAIMSHNVNLPTGNLYGTHSSYIIQADGQLMNAEAYNTMIVSYKNGKPVYLKNIGRILNDVQNNKTGSWLLTQKTNERAVVLAIMRQPGSNTVAVTDDIKKLLPQLRLKLPASMKMTILYDRSENIRESVNDVKFTLVLTLILVIMVIFVFLRNLSATLIPSVAVPMSIIGTFAVMYVLGYSLDTLSLMALVLSVGFVVDDAIVVLENIVRHMEMGKGPYQAAVDGTKEIGFTVVSMTLSLAAVFIPIMFMPGILGRLFSEFAVTIGVAILLSGFISLSLAPVLASRLLKVEHEVKHGRLYLATEKVFDGMLSVYSKGLRWSLSHKTSILIVSIIILIATGYLFTIIPMGFLPSEDRNFLMGMTEGPQGVGFNEIVRQQKRAAEIAQQDENIEQFISIVGGGGMINQNQGRLVFMLKPKKERKMTADQIMIKLRKMLYVVPGLTVYIQNPPPITVGGRTTNSLYQYTMYAFDTKELYSYANRMQKEMRKVSGLVGVASDLQISAPQINVEIDREKARKVGVTASQIEEALYDAYGSRWISTIYSSVDQYQVQLETHPDFQLTPEALTMLYVRSSNQKLVPLNTVARLKETTGPMAINHTGQIPSVTISFDLEQGVSIGTAMEKINSVAKNIVKVPPSITSSFQGQAQAFQSSMQGMGFLLILAILVIYMILGILYESFIHPITILTALPFAGFGAVVTLLIFKMELNIYAMVGVIMLIGIVKKNGIMMIDFALGAVKEGKSPYDAIYEACTVRFRPIMMTTMAALLGTVPIAVGYGAGGESRQPLGVAVVGGLLFSQMLTLFVTPVFYLYFDSLQTWLRKKKGKRKNTVTETTIVTPAPPLESPSGTSV